MEAIDELLTPEEVSAILKVKTQTLAEWRFYRRELHKHIKVGGRVRYLRSVVRAYIESAMR